MAKKSVGEKSEGEEFVGEKSVGEKPQGAKFVGEDSVGEKIVGLSVRMKSRGRWDAGFRFPLLRFIMTLHGMSKSQTIVLAQGKRGVEFGLGMFSPLQRCSPICRYSNDSMWASHVHDA